MRTFNITVAVSVDTDNDQQAAQYLSNALIQKIGKDNDAFQVVATHKQKQVPALFRPLHAANQ